MCTQLLCKLERTIKAWELARNRLAKELESVIVRKFQKGQQFLTRKQNTVWCLPDMLRKDFPTARTDQMHRSELSFQPSFSICWTNSQIPQSPSPCLCWLDYIGMVVPPHLINWVTDSKTTSFETARLPEQSNFIITILLLLLLFASSLPGANDDPITPVSSHSLSTNPPAPLLSDAVTWWLLLERFLL